MRIRSIKLGRGGSSRARRRAAEAVLAEGPAGTVSPLGPEASGELGTELAAMRSLVQTLERLPAEGWGTGLEPASRPASSPQTTPAPLGRPSFPGLTGAFGRLGIAPGIGGSMAAVALAAAFFVGALTHPFSASTRRLEAVVSSPRHVVLRPLPGAGTTGLAVAYMPGGGHMLLSIRDLPRSAPGSYYELWLMTSDTHLVSVTSFRVGVSGTGSLQLVLPDDPSHYRYLDISLQHVGGAPVISQDNVLRGALPA